MIATVLLGDCIEQMRTLEAGSVQCCVTSPPYWGLRAVALKEGRRFVGCELNPDYRELALRRMRVTPAFNFGDAR